MLDAPGNHIVPIGSWVEVGRRRLFSLAHAQNVVVVQQVAGFTRDRVRTNQARQLLGFLMQFVGQVQCTLPMVVCGDDCVIRLLDQDQKHGIRAEREQHDREEPRRYFAKAHAFESAMRGSGQAPLCSQPPRRLQPGDGIPSVRFRQSSLTWRSQRQTPARAVI